MLSSAPGRDRLTAAAGALLLQLGFIAAFLYALPRQTPAQQLEHELTFFLPRLPSVVPPKQQMRAAPRPAATAPLPLYVSPPPPTPSAPTLSLPTNLQNFGHALNSCAPETYSSLTSQQRALCARPGEGVAIQEAPSPMGAPSHVKDEAHWANAIAHEKSPVLLPGASQNGLGLKVIGVDSSGKVSGLAGSSSDSENWPTYNVKLPAPEDFYKTEQAYDAWSKAHAARPASGAEGVSVHPQ